MMTTVEEIQAAIQFLSPEDFAYLRKWIAEIDWEQWDKQIEKDSETGKLNFLIEEALAEKEQDQLLKYPELYQS